MILFVGFLLIAPFIYVLRLLSKTSEKNYYTSNNFEYLLLKIKNLYPKKTFKRSDKQIWRTIDNLEMSTLNSLEATFRSMDSIDDALALHLQAKDKIYLPSIVAINVKYGSLKSAASEQLKLMFTDQHNNHQFISYIRELNSRLNSFEKSINETITSNNQEQLNMALEILKSQDIPK